MNDLTQSHRKDISIIAQTITTYYEKDYLLTVPIDKLLVLF